MKLNYRYYRGTIRDKCYLLRVLFVNRGVTKRQIGTYPEVDDYYKKIRST